MALLPIEIGTFLAVMKAHGSRSHRSEVQANDQICSECPSGRRQPADSRRITGTPMNGLVPQASRSIEQAAALLDATNQKELEAVLRRLIDAVARRSGGTLNTDRARAVLAIVKNTAERTLPTLTTVFGAGDELTQTPGNSPVATAAQVYGLELEGLSAEDRDFEIARQLIRFAEAATRQAANPPSSVGAAAAVNAAIGLAAREFAPGLLYARHATPERSVRGQGGLQAFEPGLRRRDVNEPPDRSHSRNSTKGIPHV
jgi:hypothetical protein